MIDHKNWFNNQIYLIFNCDCYGYKGYIYYNKFKIRSIGKKEVIASIDKKYRHYKIKHYYLFLLDEVNHLIIYRHGVFVKQMNLSSEKIIIGGKAFDYNKILCVSDDLKYIMLCH